MRAWSLGDARGVSCTPAGRNRPPHPRAETRRLLSSGSSNRAWGTFGLLSDVTTLAVLGNPAPSRTAEPFPPLGKCPASLFKVGGGDLVQNAGVLGDFDHAVSGLPGT